MSDPDDPSDARPEATPPARREESRADRAAKRAAEKAGKAADKKAKKQGEADAASGGQGRDETDSFIAEVSEELRRDRLNRAFRRYGPWVGGVIVAVVVGAAVNEYLNASAVSSARERGAALMAAAEADDPAAALEAAAADSEGGARALAQLAAAAAHVEAGDTDAAVALYESVSGDTALGPRYRQVATLRAVMAQLDSAEPAALISDLAPLTAQGAPYRSLALELTGSLHMAAGDGAAARETLEQALSDPTTPSGVRARVSALLDSLGVERFEPALPVVPPTGEGEGEGDADG